MPCEATTHTCPSNICQSPGLRTLYLRHNFCRTVRMHIYNHDSNDNYVRIMTMMTLVDVVMMVLTINKSSPLPILTLPSPSLFSIHPSFTNPPLINRLGQENAREPVISRSRYATLSEVSICRPYVVHPTRIHHTHPDEIACRL